jgi:hypothetical protein
MHASDQRAAKFSMMLPEVAASLRDKKIESVLVVGIEVRRVLSCPCHALFSWRQAHVCVLQTTLDLLQEGYKVVILSDAVSSCNAEERQIAFDVSFPAKHGLDIAHPRQRMRTAGAQISTTESAIFELMGACG